MIKPMLTAALLERARDATAQACQVPPVALLAASRRPPVVRARWVLWLALRAMTAASVVELGQACGRHHTTVLYGLEQGGALIEADDAYRAAYVTVCEVLR